MTKFPKFEQNIPKQHHDWYDEDAKAEVEQALSKSIEHGRKQGETKAIIFGNKKAKERITKLEKELAKAKETILDYQESRITVPYTCKKHLATGIKSGVVWCTECLVQQSAKAEQERIWKAYVDFIVTVNGQVEIVHIRTEDEIEDFIRFQCGHPRLKSQLSEVNK